jgi:hypothetical protein
MLCDRPGTARRHEEALVGGSVLLSEDGRPTESFLTRTLPAFEETSVEVIVQYCDDHARALRVSEAIAAVQRLYDIAFFEHNITDERREKALERIQVLKRAIDPMSIDDDKSSLSQFEDDYASVIETVSRIGRGSLLWKLVEDRVPES